MDYKDLSKGLLGGSLYGFIASFGGLFVSVIVISIVEWLVKIITDSSQFYYDFQNTQYIYVYLLTSIIGCVMLLVSLKTLRKMDRTQLFKTAFAIMFVVIFAGILVYRALFY